MNANLPVVLAVMQNMWVKDPVRVRSQIEKHGPEYRRRLIAMALFMGCVSGRRLQKAFGEELCSRIVWDESTRQIEGDAKTIPPSDPEHVQALLAELKPAVVLTFGKVAYERVAAFWKGKVIALPHPAARHADVPARLLEGAARLRVLLATIEFTRAQAAANPAAELPIPEVAS
ncbi:MAG TPA: hypothetical protein VMB21_18650 [Candidatus Limnocylindria bacterium]|nr:hypothetical protein [Candidatus Limnocylindria bacterium]